MKLLFLKDELKQALKEESITKKEYVFANKVSKKIIDYILNNREKCDKLCFQYFKILREKLGDK